jgi:hypothetical protein
MKTDGCDIAGVLLSHESSVLWKVDDMSAEQLKKGLVTQDFFK